jgi:hypothetical protein
LTVRKAERRIEACKVRIERQESFVKKLTEDGYDGGVAGRVLSNLHDLHEIYVSYRQAIIDGLTRSAP